MLAETPQLHASRAFQISCIVPVSNDGAILVSFLKSLYGELAGLATHCDIIVVDDGSIDDSRAKIVEASAEIPLRHIELSRRFGPASAIRAGLDAARGDCTLVIHPTCEHPMSVIAYMVRRWRAGVSVIYATAGSDDASAFRLLDRRVVSALGLMREREGSLHALCEWTGFRTEGLPGQVHRQHRLNRRRRFIALDSIAASSAAPLRLLSVGGAAIASAAFLFGCAMVLEKLFRGQPIPGFTTLITAICMLGGVQLVVLGLVREYVGRIFNEVKARPVYLTVPDEATSAADRLQSSELPLESHVDTVRHDAQHHGGLGATMHEISRGSSQRKSCDDIGLPVAMDLHPRNGIVQRK